MHESYFTMLGPDQSVVSVLVGLKAGADLIKIRLFQADFWSRPCSSGLTRMFHVSDCLGTAMPSSVISSFPLYFNVDEHVFKQLHHTNENITIGATFSLPSKYNCTIFRCIVDLKLTLETKDQLSTDLWCDSPAIVSKEKLSCTLNNIEANRGSYRLSAIVQLHNAGSFLPIYSVVFPNHSDANYEWSGKHIIVINSLTNVMKRNRRYSINTDDKIQLINQPLQLNMYSGMLNFGHTADFTCNQTNTCPDYPKMDLQGRTTCCFPLPQVSNAKTTLSSIIYQRGAQNLKDYQIIVGNDQSFNAANDRIVFLNQTIPTSQCLVRLPFDTIQDNDVLFRLTWTYHSNSANNLQLATMTSTIDGILPVNVLRITRNSVFIQQTDEYNEWFVCPPSQNERISLLRSIAVLFGENIDYFRCIYVNKQGIPLKNPSNDQLLVMTSTKDDIYDDPSITTLPTIHTDCLSIQFFPKISTTINLDSIILAITIAFQLFPSSDMISIIPQQSNLQGTSQINIEDINTTIGEYIGTFVIPSEYPQQTILHSITVTGSSNVLNPIIVRLVDRQGNTLSQSYNLLSGKTLESNLKISLSKLILQATALQDIPMDFLLHMKIVLCPHNIQSSIENKINLDLSVQSSLVNNQTELLPTSSQQIPPQLISTSDTPFNMYNDIIGDGLVNFYESNVCFPGDINMIDPLTHIIITILKTKDQQPPRNVQLDLQGCYISSISPFPIQSFQNSITPATEGDNCFNQIPLDNPDYISNIQTSHQSICDNPPSDFNINANGCHFNILPSSGPVTFSIRFKSPVVLSSVSMGIRTNVNTFIVQLFDTNGQLITSNDDMTGAYMSSVIDGILTSSISSDVCPQISLTTHPDVQLIIFNDGTNVTRNLDPDGDGCDLISIDTTMTVLLTTGRSATFSSIGVSSPNVNQIDVALFDEISNRPLIQSSPHGIIRSARTLNPSIQNLPLNPASTITITFLSTTDGQPPRNVKLLIYACFPTTSITSPSDESNSSPYQNPSIKPINICIDPFQPAQPLPPAYYSSSQCVCICQDGFIIPQSSGAIQYDRK
ncbi:hypothetical protein I4U23_017648 [Adineta vaga]|nr:hypothetical protein I4U23_017648 [Adineta vaga]